MHLQLIAQMSKPSINIKPLEKAGWFVFAKISLIRVQIRFKFLLFLANWSSYYLRLANSLT